MPLRWAVSGTGDINAKAVAPAIVASLDAELISFHSRTPERAAEFAQRFGARRATANLAECLADPDVDIVYVGGEVNRHRPETIAAAEAGRHVLVEKPMALDSAECRAMIDACRAKGVHLAVAYYRRYYPQVLRLKELVDDGAVGTPLQAGIDMAYYYNPARDDPKYWRVEPAGGGGALQDIGSHRLDVACWLLGEPARVAGVTAHRALDYHAADVETVVCEFASGCHLTLRCTWAAGANQDAFCLVGTDGVIQCGAFEETSFLLRRRGRPDEVIAVDPPATNRHQPLIDDVSARLLAGRPPRHDGGAGWQASRIIAAAYRSAATGAWEEAS